MSAILTIGIWNTEWKASNSHAGKAMASMLLDHNPEVVCVTEGHLDQIPGDWHVCASGPDHGYRRNAQAQRKVILFSRSPWSSVDQVGSAKLPPGRFVTAVTETSIGQICFVGVCIPWRMAHVVTGMRNRTPWEDHKAYLRGFEEIVRRLPKNTVIVGDFNQQKPMLGQPVEVEQLLDQALGTDFGITTGGAIPGLTKLPVDHLACRHYEFLSRSIKGLPKVQKGTQLSDHDGLVLDIERT